MIFATAHSRSTRTLQLAGWLAAVTILFGVATPVAAQTVANGTLLVASPELSDPNFARAVVLVLRHDDEGTIGIILNRPTNLVAGDDLSRA